MIVAAFISRGQIVPSHAAVGVLPVVWSLPWPWLGVRRDGDEIKRISRCRGLAGAWGAAQIFSIRRATAASPSAFAFLRL